jgi:glycosyltransferase involved in cell wall biosynthesis
MFITVLICTRNRAPDLRITLESLLIPANLGASDWEVIVVDNHSTDRTSAVCREFQKRFPHHFSFLFEPKKGKSHALNTGIAAARGEVIAMTDDDVLLAAGYLAGIRAVFSQPSVDVAQGRVFLECAGGRPPWMDREMAYVVAGRDYGDQVLECKKDLVGVNMIVRTEVFRKVGGFRTDLGPGKVGLCEDTEFTRRVYQAGLRAIYAPQIVVRHRIPPQRLTKSSMRHYYFILGRSLAHYNPLPAPLWRFGLYVGKELVLNKVKAIWLRFARRPAEALHGQCNARLQAGMLLEHWRLRRGASRTKSSPSPGSGDANLS